MRLHGSVCDPVQSALHQLAPPACVGWLTGSLNRCHAVSASRFKLRFNWENADRGRADSPSRQPSGRWCAWSAITVAKSPSHQRKRPGGPMLRRRPLINTQLAPIPERLTVFVAKSPRPPYTLASKTRAAENRGSHPGGLVARNRRPDDRRALTIVIVSLNATLRSSSPWISRTGDRQVLTAAIGEDSNAVRDASVGTAVAALALRRVLQS